MIRIVRVRCPHRIGLAFLEGNGFSCLPCDCNNTTEVLETYIAKPVRPLAERMLALADEIAPTDRISSALIRAEVLSE